MSTTTISVKEKLEALFQLQTIDSQIDGFKVLKGQLPIEVSDLEDEIAGLQTRVDKLNTQLSDINSEVGKHKENIINSNTLIEKYNKQLEDVKNNREFEALTKEVELQNLENQLSEKKIRENQEVEERKKEILAITTEKMEAKTADLEKKKVELEQIIEKTEKDEAKLEKKSVKTRKQIEDRLLKSYDRIRNRYKNGLAVVPVKRSACGGCFNRIPAQTQIELGNHKAIIACEHCGRVLVDNETAGITDPE